MSELNALSKPESVENERPEAAENEWLSALFDGELSDEETRRLISGDDDAAARRWSEYSLIGDVLRGNTAGRPDFGARMHAALAAEPTVLAPKPLAPAANRPYYWMAAAAAVAAIAWSVVSVAPQSGGEVAIPVAAYSPLPPDQTDASAVQAYMAAHQDYAYTVGAEPEMSFTRVSLTEDAR
jgi:sigma-E factor negative regulatory protein RseA